MLCTYKYFEKEDSDIAHICYQTQLLQVFNMNEFDDKILENNIKNLYSCIKKSDKIQEIIMFLSNDMSQEIFNLFNNKDSSTNIDEFSIFQILFSYEYFDIFHKYISIFINNFKNSGEKSDKCLDNLLEKLKELKK
tara:strand:+ start:1489 stop:1896 length:408 start_codon:yes stop_codon:yes gene_type:complete